MTQIFIEKYLHINGPAQLKHVLSKGQQQFKVVMIPKDPKDLESMKSKGPHVAQVPVGTAHMTLNMSSTRRFSITCGFKCSGYFRNFTYLADIEE